MLHADLESRWFRSWLVVQGRLYGRRRSLWGEVVLPDPGGEWLGEGSLVTAGAVEVLGCVDEGGGWWGVSGGPGVPGVEGIHVLFGGGEPVGVAVEAAGELLVDLEVLLQPVLLLTELVAFVEEWPGAACEFVERGAGGGDVGGGLVEGVAGGAAVEASGGGEFSFGVASALLGVVEVGGGAGDGLVVGCAGWLEVGELSAELVDVLSEVGVALLFGGVGGSCVGELGAGCVVEVVEPVGPSSRTDRPRQSTTS